MINTYNKKVLRMASIKVAKSRAETKDAVLWDVIPGQKLCRVKVQGSDVLITAKYPENWGKIPDWLKPGNSVKVMFTGGNRLSAEIIGNGITIPTPLPGSSGDVQPETGPNSVITGMLVYAFVDDPSMTVWVSIGTYRISGIYYALPEMTMEETNPITMDSGVSMSECAGGVTLDAAHATLWRMDSIVVGIDGVIDVLTGVPSSTDPDAPEVPSEHVLISTVLVPPGVTQITQGLVNVPYDEPYVSVMRVTPASEDLYWDDSSNSILIEALDQYGNLMLGSSYGVAISILNGTGTISASATIGTDGDGTATYYRKSGYQTNPVEDPEEGPIMIQFEFTNGSGILMITTFNIRNALGGLILL